MPIRDNPQYKDADEQLRLLRALRFLRPLYHLLGEQGRQALDALDRLPAVGRQLEEHRSAADEFNAAFLPRGWIAHENMNYHLGLRAVALAKGGDIDAGERLLVESIDRETVTFALRRVGRLDEFRGREDLLHLALDDHCAGRYHASVMPVLAQVDGIVHDLTKEAFYIGANGDPARLVIDDSIVGHVEGIAALAMTLSTSRGATTTAPLDLPHRHGILHGRDLGYANQTVSAKCFGLLLALCSFAELYDRERLKHLALVGPQPEPPPTLRGTLRKLQAVRDPRTYFLSFPPPMIGNSRKYRQPLDPSDPLTAIPCLGARRLARELQALGFTYRPPTRLVGGLSWLMTWESAGATYRVDVVGSSAEEIRRVAASFLGVPPHATAAHGIDFLGFVATVPYQGAEPARAQAWVRDHYGIDAETVIGGAHFRLSHHEPWADLRIVAVHGDL